MPIERQAQIYRRSGIDIPSNTMVDWVKAGGHLLQPIARRIHERVLRAHVLQVDDTGLLVLQRDDASEHTTVFYTVLQTAVIHDHEPWATLPPLISSATNATSYGHQPSQRSSKLRMSKLCNPAPRSRARKRNR